MNDRIREALAAAREAMNQLAETPNPLNDTTLRIVGYGNRDLEQECAQIEFEEAGEAYEPEEAR